MSDNSAFELFVANHQDMVFTTAIRLLQNTADAEDVAQEVFLRAFRDFAKLRDNPCAGGWLRCVARNLSINHLTRYRSRWRLFSDFFRPNEDDDSSTPLEAMMSHDVNPAPPGDMQVLVREALLTLPAKQRVPLVLYHYEELSYQEIADALNIRISQVKTDIHRGREALKAKIQRLGGQSDRGILPLRAQGQAAGVSPDFHCRARQDRLAASALSLMKIQPVQEP
jgi:RNA polymerase sigma-70 factor (ECF subfamily)